MGGGRERVEGEGEEGRIVEKDVYLNKKNQKEPGIVVHT